ncbi:MAG: 1-deoxy-D-xylulose-5-phosphate synthase [Firmicutes bacterium]|nr:1-deoxy-D-xylulose-5-phosphate synthase [Bacillota bacterium]
MNSEENNFNYQKIKDMDKEQLETLAIQMRSFILENVSHTGGHLSSNLGIVDLTLSMLKVFDPAKDLFLFDVGHQCYPYKILTGRAGQFSTLRKYKGLSGFQARNESRFDCFEAGHSSTSISTGLGMAIARDLNDEDFEVISIIGDGSISNGLAYEALNHLGDVKTKQIIILNDNQMSISENVGAVHNLLDQIRSAKGYRNAKENTKSFLNKTKLGSKVACGIDAIKNNVKKIYLKQGSIFENFGIEYYGPINGHDFEELDKYLKIAKEQKKPVLLHVITKKGCGYPLAEDDKIGKFHGIAAFDIKTGAVKSPNNLPSFSEIVSSYVYNFAKKDKDIICITPGMCYGNKLETIKEKLPDQYLDVGIAEEHSLLLANGLAIKNKKPIVFIYSTFLQRGYDEIVHDIARMNSNLTLCIDRAGLVPGDGVSHQGVFDIPMLISVPNMVITMPKDAKEANDLIYTSLNFSSPFAIRFPKINIKYDYGRPQKLPIGSWEVLRKGTDGFIITYGDLVSKALNVADKLQEKQINLCVVNARFIKPHDKEMFNQIIKLNKPIYIYEESMKIGSLGSVLAQEALSLGFSSKLQIFAIDDQFLTHASRDELLKITGLDETTILNKIQKDFA